MELKFIGKTATNASVTRKMEIFVLGLLKKRNNTTMLVSVFPFLMIISLGLEKGWQGLTGPVMPPQA